MKRRFQHGHSLPRSVRFYIRLKTREAVLDLHSGLFGLGFDALFCMIHLLVFRGDLKVSPAVCHPSTKQLQYGADAERARLGKHL